MLAAKHTFTMEQGSLFKRKFMVLDSNGTQLNLTGKIIRMCIRQSKMLNSVVAKFDLASGSPYRHIYLDGTDNGAFHLVIYPYESKLFDWFTHAYYDLTLTTFTADNEVTQESGTYSIPNDGTYGTNMTDLLGEVAQTTGTGLNDLAYTGPYSGTGATCFRVIMGTPGAPDKFEWGTVDRSVTPPAYTQVAANINCVLVGAKHTLQDGIAVYFGATTGHTEGDAFDFAVVARRAGAPAGQAVPEAYEVDYDPGILYPSTAAGTASGRAAAKYAKIYRHFPWLPSHGPIYSDAAYVPGATVFSASDLTVTGELTAVFNIAFWDEVQWECQVETGSTFRWRANAGGSGYGWGLTDDSPWIAQSYDSTDYWNAINVTMAKTPTAAQHLTSGIYVQWADKTYVAGDHWFFKTKAPLISLVTGETLPGGGTHNGIYRLQSIYGSGEGLKMRTLINGNSSGTMGPEDNTSDITLRVKSVLESQLAVSRILEGVWKVKPLVTHDEKYIADRYPTFTE